TQALIRLEAKKARQDEIDYLQDIEIERGRKHWDRALALCDDFAKKFPKSGTNVKADVEKRKKSIGDAKHKEQVNKVWIEMHSQSRLWAHSRAADPKVGIDEAQQYAQSQMRKDILAAATKVIQKDYKDLTDAEVDKLWKERGKSAKSRSVSYGGGTFI